ncbi:BMFP domain-containing protein YqiC [Sphingomonas zeicaulis]|uniref:accessory factor UbiK family protein n=1 Tax=Sphingomonas zeicaulis TaxID=1632740 RepID=UPI003D196BDA
MQTENRFFDDLAKLMNGAAGTLAGMGREAEASARQRAREWIGGLDFVSRDEFEAVKAMAAAARDEVDELRARLAALEAASGVAAPVAASCDVDLGKPASDPVD